MSRQPQAASAGRRPRKAEICLHPEGLLGSAIFLDLLKASAQGVYACNHLGAWALADWLDEQGDFGLADCVRQSLSTPGLIALPPTHLKSWRPVVGCEGGLFTCVGRRLLGPALRANRPGLGLIQTLDLQACQLGPEALIRLLEQRAMGQLIHLNLRDNPLGDSAMASLAQSNTLGQLLELNLWGCDITRQGAQHLALASGLGNLIRLNLRSNFLTLEGVGAILESECIGRVESLVLQRVRLEDGPVDSQPGWPALKSLHLGNNQAGPQVIRWLVGSDRLSKLEHLELNGNRIRSLGAKELAHARHWKNLRILEARDNRIGPGGARVLTNLKLPALEVLDLRKNWLGDPGRKILKHSTMTWGPGKVQLKLGENEPRPRLPVGMRPPQAGNLIRRAWMHVRGLFGL